MTHEQLSPAAGRRDIEVTRTKQLDDDYGTEPDLLQSALLSSSNSIKVIALIE